MQGPTTRQLERLDAVDELDDLVQWNDAVAQEPLPASLHVYTNGSGGGVGTSIAGWGVAVFEMLQGPVVEDMWTDRDPCLAAIYGPVLTQTYDPMWLGAEAHTNSTGELTAIGEACRWMPDLLERMPANWSRILHLHYDSEYAYGAATRLFRAKENLPLIETVANLVSAVRRKFTLTFQHVQGHSGNRRNDVADVLAARGALGRVSPHCAQLLEGVDPVGPDAARSRGASSTTPTGGRKRPARAPDPEGVKRGPRGHKMVPCPLCLQEFKTGDLAQHQPQCRGRGMLIRHVSTVARCWALCRHVRTTNGTSMLKKH